MIYPEFLKEGSLIGICAPSAGTGHKIESFERSESVLEKEGYRILESASVREDSPRGGDAAARGRELNALFADPSVTMVMAATGGDFLDEMLPFADFDLMREHPKWLMGASAPTGLLYPYTTLCDVATLYGCNAGSFDCEGAYPDYIADALSILKGGTVVQKSSAMHLGTAPFLAQSPVYDTPTRWEGSGEEIYAEGRCIGGCIDVLKDLIGTRFDGTKKFLERYASQDGIIWYFDNFSLSAEMLYRTFLQMKYAGWLENAQAVLLGRTLFEKSESGMSYEEACRLAFGRPGDADYIPWIRDMDIGHTIPHMTMINGAMLQVQYQGGAGSLKFSLT